MRNYQGGFRKSRKPRRVVGVGFTNPYGGDYPKDYKGTEPERHFTPNATALPATRNVVVPLTDRGYGREVIPLD